MGPIDGYLRLLAALVILSVLEILTLNLSEQGADNETEIMRQLSEERATNEKPEK